jgi:malonate decarboxylase epsilon subunit
MGSVALLFPGQGAQSPGFLHRLPKIAAVDQVLKTSSEILGYDVLSLDTEVALASTVSTQLSVVIAGAAFWTYLASEGAALQAVAGMSVGTFAAAIASGALALEDALRLVKLRAELMQATPEADTGRMAVIDGLQLAQVESALQGSGLSIANFNSRTQFVIAGAAAELDSLLHRATEMGAFRASFLRTSVCSHIPQLEPASRQLLAAARQVSVQAPKTTYLRNRDARPIRTADGAREELAFNMARPVRWHDIMSAMEGLGITLMLESPPGHTLAPLASESLSGISVLSASDIRWDVLSLAVRQSINS